jgi:hypothetical protein
MSQTDTPIHTQTCHACNDTRLDIVFGTPCTECDRYDTHKLPLTHVEQHVQHQHTTTQQHTAAPSNAATAKQIAFLNKLIAERDVENPLVAALIARMSQTVSLSKREASSHIDAMLSVDRTPKTTAPKPTAAVTADVPDGYYAVESTGHNDLAFYRITHSDKWGISAQLIVGGHPDSFVRRVALPSIVERIAVDPTAAGKRYADEIGSCYRCNRTLTDETSRQLGIGPVCRNL